MAQLLDGKATGEKIKQDIAIRVKALVAAGNKKPHLVAVLVGDDGASKTYVGAKVKACEQIGFESTLITMPADSPAIDLFKVIEDLNTNPEIDGFIVQSPLPNHMDEQAVIEAINPKKDVDGFHPVNVGRMALGLPCFLPATPYGIIQLMDHYNIETSGKHAVVIGRSHIVGSPMSILLAQNAKVGNCTVTLTHSRTKNLKELCQDADILVVALGKYEFITADYVKEGAVVIDVGITRVPDETKKRGYRVTGDVLFDDVVEKASYITPVPGGVGPMTIVSLMMNTMKAAELRAK